MKALPENLAELRPLRLNLGLGTWRSIPRPTDFSLTPRILLLLPHRLRSNPSRNQPLFRGRFDCWSTAAEPLADPALLDQNVTSQNRRIRSLVVLAALGISALHAGVKGRAALGSLADSMPVQESQSNPEHSTAAAQPQSPLNFEEHPTRAQPVFLKKREGALPSYPSHSTLTPPPHLQPSFP